MLDKRSKIHKFRLNMVCAAYYGIAIKWNEIDYYLNEKFYSALELWGRTKLWGLANGNIGWANEPRDYIEAISILESEQNRIENEKMKKQLEESKKNTPSAKKG